MDILKRTDPFILTSAVVALVLAASSDPWWTLSGAGNNLLTIKVSPFYFDANAIGFSSTVPFAGFLGPFTRILLILTFVALGMVALNPTAWWREITVYFSLSALIEVYLSFLLMYHSAETALLGGYGVVPPYSGAAYLPTTIVGLDFNNYLRPLVTAGFALPFYLGFIAIGLVGSRLIVDNMRRNKDAHEHRGVAAVFTSDDDDT